MVKSYRICAVLTVALLLSSSAHANSLFDQLADRALHSVRASQVSVPATEMVSIGFSPNEGALELVLKVIDSSRSSIHMLAYSFTSAPVVNALIRAKKRGVDVSIEVDYKNNVLQDRSGKARAAMGAVVNAGIHLRTIRRFPIHHDKSIVSDLTTVQTGSFNYSQAAAKSNSENVIVLWNNPKLAAGYMDHWRRNWSFGNDYANAY